MPEKSSITLGTYGAAHLGDALCLSPLPKLISETHQIDVYLTRHPSLTSALLNDPHIKGFVDRPGIPLKRKAKGYGHLIQRLQQGFDLPVHAVPRPKLYLSNEEIRWAEAEAAKWPKNKPACLISTRTLTDGGHYKMVDWLSLGQEWSKSCNVIQPVITKPKTYNSSICTSNHLSSLNWQEEPVVEGAVVYEDLPLRHYLALFSVCNYFCGSLSGGSHAAAAFDLPSLIVIWDGLYNPLSFPVATRHSSPEIFLYPQHLFLPTSFVDTPTHQPGAVAEFVARVLELDAASQLVLDDRHRSRGRSYLPKLQPKRAVIADNKRIRVIPVSPKLDPNQ